MAGAGSELLSVALNEPCAKEAIMQRRIEAVNWELRQACPRQVIPLERGTIRAMLRRLARHKETASDQCLNACGVNTG